MKFTYDDFDLSGIHTYPLASRKSKARAEDFAKPCPPGASIDAFLAGFDERIGLDRLVMIHLNDTRSAFASRTDRHEHLGAGRIPVAGLRHIVRHPSLVHAAYILETPGMDSGYDAVNMERARLLWSGDALPTLPREAFELPSSSRGRMSSGRTSARPTAPRATARATSRAASG